MGVSVLDLRLTGWREVTLGSGQRATTRTLIGQRVSSGFGQGALALFAPYFLSGSQNNEEGWKELPPARKWVTKAMAAEHSCRGSNRKGAAKCRGMDQRWQVKGRVGCLNTLCIERWHIAEGRMPQYNVDREVITQGRGTPLRFGREGGFEKQLGWPLIATWVDTPRMKPRGPCEFG